MRACQLIEQVQSINLVVRQPHKLSYRAPHLHDLQALLTSYLLEPDLSTFSISSLGQALQSQEDMITQLLCDLIDEANWSSLFQRVKYLNKFLSLDPLSIIVSSIKQSNKKSAILKQMVHSHFDLSTAHILSRLNEASVLKELSAEKIRWLLKDGDLLTAITCDFQLAALQAQLLQAIKAHITPQMEINQKHLISILLFLKLEEEVESRHIRELVGQFMSKGQYQALHQLIRQASDFGKYSYVLRIQNYISEAIKAEEIVYCTVENLFLQPEDQFLLNNILPKIHGSNYFQQLLLQKSVESYIENNKFFQQKEFQESLSNLSVQGSFVIASNFYWNRGEVKLDCDQLPKLKGLGLPLVKEILRQFQCIKLEQNKRIILAQVTLQVAFRQQLLYLDPWEFSLLAQFQKSDIIKQPKDMVCPRLLRLGVVEKTAGENLRLVEENFKRLQGCNYLERPEPKQALDEEDNCAPNRKLIVEAWAAKFMKQEKRMERQHLYQKLCAQLKKQLKLVTEAEVGEALKGLTLKSVILIENDVIFYNI